MLNAIIAINPDAVKEARLRDKTKLPGNHPIYGMPVLLKDNVDAADMATTAGAVALQKNHPSDEIIFRSVAEVTDFNKEDTLNRIPYGQTLFIGMLKEYLAGEELAIAKAALHEAGVLYFDKPMTEYNLDAVLSINNSSAGFAATAAYPCLTVPMGYSEAGEPASLTFIARPFEEDKLLKMGFAFEKATKVRRSPEGYK